jgi:hypothetical protein
LRLSITISRCVSFSQRSLKICSSSGKLTKIHVTHCHWGTIEIKVVWQVEDEDVSRVKDFYDKNKDSNLVASRNEINVEGKPPKFSRASFWRHMVGCLLTTQQRSGPTSPVPRFNGTYPFPLNYTEY